MSSSGKSKNWFASKSGKTFMKYATSWGATVVIVGAMFKILHLPGGSFVIGLGLSVEALLFFIAAFEPEPEHLDWTLVYPELKMGHDVGQENVYEEIYEEDVSAEQQPRHINGSQSQYASHLGFDNEAASSDTFDQSGVQNFVNSNVSASASEKISQMMDAANIDESLIQGLSESIQNLSKAAGSIGEVMSVPLDQKKYSEQLNVAANNLESLNSFYEIQIEQSQLQADVSKSLLDNLSNTVENSSKLHEQVRALTDNMSMLNTVYGGMLSAMKR